ncbi:MAG: MoaD family protein [Methanophagales archaeon]|nr:MoaD family protein [Methanophagales archaeon]
MNVRREGTQGCLRVRVRLFASFRELVGASEVEVELNAEDTLRDVLLKVFGDACEKIFEEASAKKLRDYVVVLRNRRHVQDIFSKLEDGDEISIFPPASGG